MAELAQKYEQDMGDFYKGRDTDWYKIADMASTAQNSAKVLFDRLGNYIILSANCGKPELREAVYGLHSNFEKYAQAKSKFDDLLGIVQHTQEHWLEGQSVLCDTILKYADRLKEWVAYCAAALQLRNIGLGNVVDFYSQGADHQDVFAAYKKAVLHGLICDAIDGGDTTLSLFSGTVFNKKIEQYKRMD